MKERIEKVIKALERNNMKGIYAEKKEDIAGIVENMLSDGAVITAGGSVSLVESGVFELIKQDKYRFLDRNQPGISYEDRLSVFKSSIGGDFYFCSSNAITENGELVNVDGFSNRVSSICFGPKSVIMIVGANKIVKDVSEGLLRVKQIAAPKNCVRLGVDTPCARLGHCISLEKTDNPEFTDGCGSERRICASYLISARQREKNRIKVIICRDNLGY